MSSHQTAVFRCPDLADAIDGILQGLDVSSPAAGFNFTSVAEPPDE